jgi:hypothetical protein
VRVYATAADLDGWLDDQLPEADAAKQLRRASMHIDSLLITAVYRVDEDGEPLDLHVIDALRDATCAQVAWWADTGDTSGAASQYQQTSIGSVGLTRGYSSGKSAAGPSARTAPEAVQILATAGLLSGAPQAG